jgi:hypothetical protein
VEDVLPSFKPEQHEVKDPAGSRFYIIDPIVEQDGLNVQVRRVGQQKTLWSCRISFENANAFQHYHGDAITTIISLAKSDLDNGFIS